MTPWKKVHHSKAARMHPRMNLPDPLVSLNESLDTPVFSSFNCFSILPEECLFLLTLSPISSSSRKCFRHCLRYQSDLRSALKISRLAVFGPSSPCSSSLLDTDLESEEPVTTLRIEPCDEIPRLSLEEGEGNRIMLQRLGTGNQQVVA